MPLSPQEELELIEIELELRRRNNQQQPDTFASRFNRPTTTGQAAQAMGELAFDSPALPIAGGIVGALGGGGAASIPLAGLGAAGGEAIRQIGARATGIGDYPGTSGEAAADIGIEGGLAAAGQGAGLGVAKFAQSRAVPMARRALGFTKRFFSDPKNLERANAAAQEMLDQGIMTPLASTEDMIRAADEFEKGAGKKIGDFLRGIEENFDTRAMISAIEELRPPNRGGAFDALHSKIDRAVETIRAIEHGADPILSQPTNQATFDAANKVKGLLQDLANWNQYRDATPLDQLIANKALASIDNTLDALANKPSTVTREGVEGFRQAKRQFQAGAYAQRGLANRLSSDAGNNLIGLRSTAMTAGQIAQYGLTPQTLAMPLIEIAFRRGGQVAAPIANRIGRAPVGAVGAPFIMGFGLGGDLRRGRQRER